MKYGIDETLSIILECICSALEDEGVPVCVCSPTIGIPAVGVLCECDSDGASGQLHGSLQRAYRLGATAGGRPDAVAKKPCAQSEWAAEYAIRLYRCFPVIDEQGEIDHDDISAAAGGLHADVATIQRAVQCCDLDEQPYLLSISVNEPPSGGVSVLTAVVQAPVSMARSSNERPGA